MKIYIVIDECCNCGGVSIKKCFSTEKQANDFVLSHYREDELWSVEEYDVHNKTMDIKLIVADDWEGLYIDGKLKDEGHTLNEGEDRAIYFAKLAIKYDFELSDLKHRDLYDEDKKHLNEYGNLPKDIKDLFGNYD